VTKVRFGDLRRISPRSSEFTHPALRVDAPIHIAPRMRFRSGLGAVISGPVRLRRGAAYDHSYPGPAGGMPSRPIEQHGRRTPSVADGSLKRENVDGIPIPTLAKVLPMSQS